MSVPQRLSVSTLFLALGAFGVGLGGLGALSGDPRGSAFADVSPPVAQPEVVQSGLVGEVDRYLSVRRIKCSSKRRSPYHPITVADAVLRKSKGARWSNGVVRRYYVCLGKVLPHSSRTWRNKGKGAEASARLAYEIRRRARLVARAMMGDDEEVVVLRARDQKKYGQPDGPTFEQLVEKAKARGHEGDAIYDSIVESSRRTSRGASQRAVR